MRVLFLGDVVGKPGRKVLQACLEQVTAAGSFDFVVVNGENAAAGSGLTLKIVRSFRKWGADVITSGDHIFKNRHALPALDGSQPLARPLNYPPDAPGRGVVVREAKDGTPVGVINLQGRVFMDPVDCPFRAADDAIAQLEQDGVRLRIVDFHAEATSEKVAMGRYLDGRVSAVLGTHTHIATADATILPGGTAYITDVGMTGPYDSVLGRSVEAVLERMVHKRPTPLPVASNDARACGVSLELDGATGKATAIERFEMPM